MNGDITPEETREYEFRVRAQTAAGAACNRVLRGLVECPICSMRYEERTVTTAERFSVPGSGKSDREPFDTIRVKFQCGAVIGMAKHAPELTAYQPCTYASKVALGPLNNSITQEAITQARQEGAAQNAEQGTG